MCDVKKRVHTYHHSHHHCSCCSPRYSHAYSDCGCQEGHKHYEGKETKSHSHAYNHHSSTKDECCSQENGNKSKEIEELKSHISALTEKISSAEKKLKVLLRRCSLGSNILDYSQTAEQI